MSVLYFIALRREYLEWNGYAYTEEILEEESAQKKNCG